MEYEIALDTTDPVETYAALAVVIAELDERRRQAEDALAEAAAFRRNVEAAYQRWAERLGVAPTYNAIDGKIAEISAGGN